MGHAHNGLPTSTRYTGKCNIQPQANASTSPAYSGAQTLGRLSCNGKHLDHQQVIIP